MNLVGLKMFLKMGGAIDLILPRQEAEAIFLAWTSRDFAVKGKSVFEGMTQDRVRYGILFAEVSCMLILPVQVQQPPAPPSWGSGGTN